jgi:hypothetical protein
MSERVDATIQQSCTCRAPSDVREGDTVTFGARESSNDLIILESQNRQVIISFAPCDESDDHHQPCL